MPFAGPFARALRFGTAISLALAVLTTTIFFARDAQGAIVSDTDGASVVASSIVDGSSRWSFKPSERCFMRKINKARRSHGLRGLNWDRQLGYVARLHANRMADQRNVWHDSRLGQRVTRWRRLAQNTGGGGRCARLFRTFMNSGPHRSNIFGTWRFIGVGTQWRGGRLYVQQVFETRRDPGNIYRWP